MSKTITYDNADLGVTILVDTGLQQIGVTFGVTSKLLDKSSANEISAALREAVILLEQPELLAQEQAKQALADQGQALGLDQPTTTEEK